MESLGSSQNLAWHFRWPLWSQDYILWCPCPQTLGSMTLVLLSLSHSLLTSCFCNNSCWRSSRVSVTLARMMEAISELQTCHLDLNSRCHISQDQGTIALLHWMKPFHTFCQNDPGPDLHSEIISFSSNIFLARCPLLSILHLCCALATMAEECFLDTLPFNSPPVNVMGQ